MWARMLTTGSGRASGLPVRCNTSAGSSRLFNPDRKEILASRSQSSFSHEKSGNPRCVASCQAEQTRETGIEFARENAGARTGRSTGGEPWAVYVPAYGFGGGTTRLSALLALVLGTPQLPVPCGSAYPARQHSYCLP